MSLLKAWILPIDTISEANCSDHWTKKHARRKKQAREIDRAFREDKPFIPLPCIVRLTRIAPRTLDKEDNLPMAFKALKDRIAFYLTGLDKGRGDSDPRITWQYDQEKGHVLTVLGKKSRGVKVEFFQA
jgi:hypothetical protein